MIYAAELSAGGLSYCAVEPVYKSGAPCRIIFLLELPELRRMRDLLSDPKRIGSRVTPPDASMVDKTKDLIGKNIVIYMNDHRLSQRQMAERLEENESLVSKVVRYHYDEFTIDRLLKYLGKLYPNVKIDINVA